MELFISLKNSISVFQEHFLSLSITILLYFSRAIFILLKPQLESLNPPYSRDGPWRIKVVLTQNHFRTLYCLG